MALKTSDLSLLKFKRLANKIQRLAPKYEKMTDAELRGQTQLFRGRLAKGEKLESLIVEGFATVIEADNRVLGMRPFYVQILGGLALFFGSIAEMRTGEGKTLTATMPLYMHGLTGPGNFLITASGYLAWRDAEDVGKVYTWLGLTLQVGTQREGEVEKELDKARIYAADIVYTTNSSLGFDYIFDNLSTELDEQFLKGFNFALIDEIDSILLDSALTALIVAGAPKLQSNLYKNSDWFVKSLVEDEDYKLSKDKKKAWFTDEALAKAEEFFGIEGILSEKWTDLYRHLVLALRANMLMKKDRDYVVVYDDLGKGEVVLLDEANGRELIGMKLQAGFHQAIEAKEDVDITNETKSIGTVTYQNLFRKFHRLSGMTGTAKTDEEELRETYNLSVYVIPTNVPMIRKDHKDKIYLSNRAKINASLDKVQEAVEAKRPVLIETGSVAMSRLYSLLLLRKKIPHNLLNATTAAKESQIVSFAGKQGAVTVATVMAGRGTDIKLEAEAKNQGLLVVGTERMTSARIDNQLRGRSGRQGEPGDSVFYVSLDDKIIIENAPKWTRKRKIAMKKEVQAGELTESVPLTKRRYAKVIDRAQKSRKVGDVSSRKEVLKFDMVISAQRERIYASRNTVMAGDQQYFDMVIDKSIAKGIEGFVEDKENLNHEKLLDFLYNNVDYYFDESYLKQLDSKVYKPKQVKKLLKHLINVRIEQMKMQFLSDFQLNYYKKIIILKALDSMWIEQLDNLEQWKALVSSRSIAGHQPIYEFQNEARKSFEKMIKETWLTILRNFLLSEMTYNEDGTIDISFP